MSIRKLLNDQVYAVGFGAMGFSHGYGKPSLESEAINLIRLAVDLIPKEAKLHIDTAEAYGSGHNEVLVGKAIGPIRSRVSLATKLFLLVPQNIEYQVRDHLTKSMERLNTNFVEVYYLHRLPETFPLQEVAETMGKLINEKKIGGWGLSQVTVDQIKAAHSFTPLTAIQSEYSMMERTYEKDVIPLCEELGIAFLPFSPMASGFLSADKSYVKPAENYKGDDVRRVITRYYPENVSANQPLLDLLHKTAKQICATPAQISLAWMLNKFPHVIPIPGMRKESRIRENLGAGAIELSAEALKALDSELGKITIHGNRTDEDIMKMGTIREVQALHEKKPMIR